MSRQVRVAPHRWHVQETGSGPTLLLLHGAGGSVHSWRDLIPALADHFHVVAIDLPGQGFTQSPGGRRLGLDPMAEDLAALLADQDWDISGILAHSAGAALGLRLIEHLGAGKLVGINPALAEFDGVAGWLFPILAKMLALNPLTVPLFTLGSSQARARRLIEGTGSKIDDEGLGLYARLLGDGAHVKGTLDMMAHWDLNPLLERLGTNPAEALFLVGSNDKAVPPKTAVGASGKMTNCDVRWLTGLGHLAHEEDPRTVLDHVIPFMEA